METPTSQLFSLKNPHHRQLHTDQVKNHQKRQIMYKYSKDGISVLSVLDARRAKKKMCIRDRFNSKIVPFPTSYLDNMAASTEQVVSNKEAIFQAEKGRTIAEKRYEVGKGDVYKRQPCVRPVPTAPKFRPLNTCT